MSKIFRIYKEGPNTYSGWNESPVYPYNSANRDTIEDPDGASAKHEITSIPSPFARIDLIKNAFKEVCKVEQKGKEPNLDGNTIFHKMVSDTLDVGEIFFNIDKFKNQIEIISWEPNVMLESLKQSGNEGHLYLADALEKFKKSDAKTYNFDLLKNIYLLNYKAGPDPLNIIGATSSSTIFFSSANDLSYIQDIYFGDDKPFDTEYQPLYKRDFEYIKMWFVLRKTIPNFAGLFPEINDYLDYTYRKISDVEKKQQLNNVDIESVNIFSTIKVSENQRTNDVEVLGYSLYKKINKVTSLVSDFMINASIEQTSHLPLVLPVESGNKYEGLKYTTALWGKSNVAPYFDDNEINKRFLPCDGTNAPYLTISDFLEEYIVKVPHTLNSENYFSGNINIDKPKLSYLLPIKPLFFKYFQTKDLMSYMKDGYPMFEMEQIIGEGVRVFLRIPIKGNGKVSYIEYSRIYYGGDNVKDLRENKGGIKTFDFTGLVMPIVRFNNEQDAYYSVSCVSTFSRNYKFSFYKENQEIKILSDSCRNINNPEVYKSVNYTIQRTNFDFIQVKDKSNISAVIIPKFKQQVGTDSYEFAVDLGTSNTHIEYRKKGARTSSVFAFDHKETLVCQIFNPSYVQGAQDDLEREQQLIQKDFLPEEVGNNEFRFPTRTVLSHSKNIDWDKVIWPMELTNIPLTYDKRIELPYNRIEDDVKWGKGNEANVIEAYIDCLMVMLRNKVLVAGGNLNNTNIIWFYPISMPPRRLQLIRRVWDEAYKKYFGGNGTIVMTESAAPIQYYFERYSTSTNLVNIDIGGGTTDIAFAKDKNIQFVTSFRFASNALFENSFSKADITNGIVDYYKEEILNILNDNDLKDLRDIYNSENNVRPANMASFLFSLSENSLLKEKKVDPKKLDFNYILQNDEYFKIVFVLFYVSIIYHVAEIVKKKGLNVPRHIAFSGNGSKVIKVITTDSKLLARFTKKIFEKVLNAPYSGDLEILGMESDSNPKESTCKGGIISAGTYENDDRDKIIISKTFGNTFVCEGDSYDEIDDFYLSNTISAVEKFFDFALIDLNNTFSYQDNFGVTLKSLELAKEFCYKDLRAFLEKGINERLEESEGNKKIAETLFFYPVRGVLNVLAKEIFDSLK